MATRLQNITELTESIGTPTVDREAGVIRNVKILGAVSKNGRTYSDKALQEAAILYSRKGVNTNHPDRATPNKARTIEEGIGWLENVSFKSGDGVYGDFAVLKSHPMANPLFEAAERNPSRFGLSHNASGDVVERGGKRIVESIVGVRSVDLVQDPATNTGLFESEDPVTKTTFKAILESVADKDHRAKALKLFEMDGMSAMGAMPMDMAAPAADGSSAPGASSDDQIRAAFKAAVTSVMDDSTLDTAGMLTKIENLLNAQAAALGIDIEAGEDEPGDTGSGDTGTGDKTVKESIQERLDKLEKRNALLEATSADDKATIAARDLLESSKVKSTPSRINAIKRTPDKAERKELLEDWLKADGPAPKPGVPKPRTSPPVTLLEDAPDGYKPPVGKEAMLAAYK